MQGLYHAAGSMLVNQVRLETISNNLSNLNTPGYKRDEVIQRTFPEYMLYRTERTRFAGGLHGSLHGPLGISAGNIAVEEIPVLHLPGGLRPTGRKLDFALQEEGFFVLETPEGMRYTRDGHFHLSPDGTLVSTQGFPVWGLTGPLILDHEYPYVDREGNVYQEGEYLDTLQVVVFPEDAVPWKEGNNLFQVAEDFAPLELPNPPVFQGTLEESNADLSRQMTDMIRVRRSYEAAQKLAQVYDSMLSRAANELGALS